MREISSMSSYKATLCNGEINVFKNINGKTTTLAPKPAFREHQSREADAITTKLLYKTQLLIYSI